MQQVSTTHSLHELYPGQALRTRAGKGNSSGASAEGPCRVFWVWYLQRGKANPQEHRCSFQQLGSWGRTQYSYPEIPQIPQILAGIKPRVKPTWSAVHCHGLSEVGVWAFSSPETHAGWWKGLGKWSTYPCHSTLPLPPGPLGYWVICRTEKKSRKYVSKKYFRLEYSDENVSIKA